MTYLRGWKEIDKALYEIAGISHDTAIRRSQAVLLMPILYDGGTPYVTREALQAWWEAVLIKQAKDVQSADLVEKNLTET